MEKKKTKKKNKLFVWDEFCPDYHDGLAFAIAPDLETAKEEVLKSYDLDVYQWGTVAIYNLTSKTIAYAIAGGE